MTAIDAFELLATDDLLNGRLACRHIRMLTRSLGTCSCPTLSIYLWPCGQTIADHSANTLVKAFRKVFPHEAFVHLTEFLGFAFVRILLRMTKPSADTYTTIVFLRQLLLQRTAEDIVVREGRFNRVNLWPSASSFWRRVCFYIIDYLSKFHHFSFRGVRPTVKDLMRAMMNFSAHECQILESLLSDAEALDLELPDRRYWTHALSISEDLDGHFADAYDVYGTSARSILMFVLRFVIYISRICPSCRQQLERMGFRVHPLWGVQTKNNNKGIWMPDPVGPCDTLRRCLAESRKG